MDDESSGELIVGEIHTIICNVILSSKTCSKGVFGLYRGVFTSILLVIMLPKPMDHMHHSHHDSTTNLNTITVMSIKQSLVKL